MFGIGIVGCGGMGGGHALAIKSGTGNARWNSNAMEADSFSGSEMTTDISKLLELKGIYDISSERKLWAEERGIYNYDSYEAMLADPELDGILIATPNHLHKDMAIQAMKAGKHVLCEKPVMMSSVDLEDVMKVSAETGMMFYPRQNREWDEDFLIVKKIYDEKLLGNVFDIECRVMGSRGIPGDWRGVKEYGGGMMLDWGVHLIDRMLVMIPEKVKTVFAHYTYISNAECDDGFKLLLTFESGLTVVLEVGTNHFINLPLWNVYADHGSAVIEDWNLHGKMVRLDDWKDKDAVPIMAGAGLTKTMAPRNANSVKELELPRFDFDRNQLYANFVRTCQGEEKQIVTQEHALRVLRLMEAAKKSSDEGQVVQFE